MGNKSLSDNELVKEISMENFDLKMYNRFNANLSELFIKLLEVSGKEIVILGIGNPRVAYDALGPITGAYLAESLCRNKPSLRKSQYGDLVGYELEKSLVGNVTLYGTYNRPIESNLVREGLRTVIQRQHPDAAVITIDASPGRKEDEGIITFDLMAIKPGSGAGADSQFIGDLVLYGYTCREFTQSNFLKNIKDHIYNSLMPISYISQMSEIISNLLKETLITANQNKKKNTNLIKSGINKPYQGEKGLENGILSGMEKMMSNISAHKTGNDRSKF